MHKLQLKVLTELLYVINREKHCCLLEFLKGGKSFIISSLLYITEPWLLFLVYWTKAVTLPLSVIGLWGYVVSLTAGIGHHMLRAAVNMKVFILNKNFTRWCLCSPLLNVELMINIIQYSENLHTPSPLWHMFDNPCIRAWVLALILWIFWSILPW